MKNTNRQDDVSIKLKERVKELSCLYKVSNISQQLEIGIYDQINRILRVIPLGWQYPEKLQVGLELNNEKFGYELQLIGISAPIIVNKNKVGLIAVEYSNHPHIPFLKEEQQLIEQIAVQIGNLVSRHEQIEQERIVSQKLRNEDRLNVLAELTAGVAHEINTPLGNILGYAEILERSTDNKQMKADARKIMKSAVSAREIVKKLMYFSCEMPSKKNLVEINKLINETSDLLSLQFKESKITIRKSLSTSKLFVFGDALQLSQVLINLLLNAKDASISGKVVQIESKQKNNQVCIIVSDSGKGIKKDDIMNLFKPFYTTKKQGTGLGLSVAHGIIQGHSGTIDVKSKEGHGTEFIISLARAEQIV